MKYSILIFLLLLGTEIGNAETSIDEINALTVNETLSQLIQAVNPKCRFRVKPKNQIEVDDEMVDDSNDVTSNYERIKVLKVRKCKVNAGTYDNLKDVCEWVQVDSCVIPEFNSLKDILPGYKSNQILKFRKRMEKKTDIERQSAISGYIAVVLKDFKLAYPEFNKKKEGWIRRFIYNTHGTEAMMKKLEDLVAAYKLKDIEAVNYKKALVEAAKNGSSLKKRLDAIVELMGL